MFTRRRAIGAVIGACVAAMVAVRGEAATPAEGVSGQPVRLSFVKGNAVAFIPSVAAGGFDLVPLNDGGGAAVEIGGPFIGTTAGHGPWVTFFRHDNGLVYGTTGIVPERKNQDTEFCFAMPLRDLPEWDETFLDALVGPTMPTSIVEARAICAPWLAWHRAH